MTPEFGHPDHCNLCRKRAGLPPLYVVPPPDEDDLPERGSVLDELLVALEDVPDAVQDVEISQATVDALLSDD